jgi:hypothetical protein
VTLIERQGSGIASSLELFLNVHKQQNPFRRIFTTNAIVDFVFHRTIFGSISDFEQVSQIADATAKLRQDITFLPNIIVKHSFGDFLRLHLRISNFKINYNLPL